MGTSDDPNQKSKTPTGSLIDPTKKVKLLIFMSHHNMQRFSYTNLRKISAVSGKDLGNFLKWCIGKKFIKKHKDGKYEIRIYGNILAEWLEFCLN